MICEEEHRYIIAGGTYSTAEEVDEVSERLGLSLVTAYHPGLIDQVVADPHTKTYCPEETRAREEAIAEKS